MSNSPQSERARPSSSEGASHGNIAADRKLCTQPRASFASPCAAMLHMLMCMWTLCADAIKQPGRMVVEF